MRTSLHPLRASRSGFTLIELLVVIAIIAILAAILFPVFARAREKARQVQCVSNARQIGMAMQAYMQDYDEWVVPRSIAVQVAPGRWDEYTFRVLVQPYVKNVAIFACPSNPLAAQQSFWPAERALGIRHGYGANGDTRLIFMHPPAVRGNPDYWPPMPPFPRQIHLAQLGRPAETILVGEVTNGWTGSEVPLGEPYRPGLTRSVEKLVFAGHSGMMTCIFADGHAKAMKPTATARPGSVMWYVNAHDAPVPPALTNNLRLVEEHWK